MKRDTLTPPIACQTDNRSERISRVPSGSKDGFGEGVGVEVDLDEGLGGRVFLRLVVEVDGGWCRRVRSRMMICIITLFAKQK